MASYLKWAGSKNSVLNILLPLFPEDYNKYIEPFLGSASVFFGLYEQMEQDYFHDKFPKAILNDVNPWLINCHKQVRSDPEKFIEHCVRIEQEYADNPKDYYFDIRSKFQALSEGNDLALRAAQFMLINKACFNGLWRVNKSDQFNVPWNKKSRVSLKSNIRACSRLLNNHASIHNEEFDIFLIKHVGSGDFVFLDPPYVPASDTANFTSYTSEKWDDEKTYLLRDVLDEIDRLGAKFMMTNSTSPMVLDLFGKWNVRTMKVHRFIKAIKSDENRNKINETIITNY